MSHIRWGSGLGITAAAVVVLASPTPALAAGSDLSDGARGAVSSVTSQVARGTAPASVAPSRSSDDSRARPASRDGGSGASSAAGSGSSSSSGSAGGLSLGGNDVAAIGTTGAQSGGGSSKADAVPLAVGGQEVLGAHAGGSGQQEAHTGDFLSPLCEGSGGSLCLELLFGDAYADSGSSSARSGVLHVCLGGDDVTGDTCSGPVGLSVLSSESSESSASGGSSEAESSARAVDLCLTPGGDCALGLQLLPVSSSAHSDGSADQDSNVVVVTAGGSQYDDGGEPHALELPPGCESPALLCLALNAIAPAPAGAVGGGAEAIGVGVVDSNVDAGLSTVGTEARPAGADGGNGGGDGGNGGGNGGSGDDRDRGTGDPVAPAGRAPAVPDSEVTLPQTGGVPASLVGLALLVTGAGMVLSLIRRTRA